MKTCKNCLWADRCNDAGERCEYFEPLYDDDSAAIEEYKQDLNERAEEYRKLVAEQQGIEE